MFDFLHIYFSFLFPLAPFFFAPTCLSLVKSGIIENELQGFLCGNVTTNLEVMSSPESCCQPVFQHSFFAPVYYLQCAGNLAVHRLAETLLCSSPLQCNGDLLEAHLTHTLTDTS